MLDRRVNTLTIAVVLLVLVGDRSIDRYNAMKLACCDRTSELVAQRKREGFYQSTEFRLNCELISVLLLSKAVGKPALPTA